MKNGLTIYERQPNHYELNILLAELAIAEGNYNEARNYIGIFEEVESHEFEDRLVGLRQILVDNG